MVTSHEEYPQLAEALQVKTLYFKREDTHPYGSHKGRSIPYMIDLYIDEGIKHFVISSSGNAALASALYISKLNKKIKLNILVGQNISTKKFDKLKELEDDYIKVTMHERPIQTLFNITKDQTIKPLRQSNDDNALIGYKSLAEELLKISNLEAIFIGTSSGTTAQALAKYFDGKVEIHIIQTTSCHPFINEVATEEDSIADAIVDHTALRKDNLLKLISGAYIASNEQIKSAQEITKNHTGLSISTNSALSIAGLMQAVYTGKTWKGPVACIICGD